MEVAAGAALVGGFLLATAKKGGKPRKSGQKSSIGLGSLPAPISAAVVAGAALFLGLRALSGRKERAGTEVPGEDTSEEAAALPNGHADSNNRAEEEEEEEASDKMDSEDAIEDQVGATPEPPVPLTPVSVSDTPDLKIIVGDVSAPETPESVEREHVPNDNETSPFNTAPNSPFYSDARPDFDKLFANGDGDHRRERERFHGDDWPTAVNVPIELLSEKGADSPKGPGVKAGVSNANDVSAILKRVKAAAARAEILHSKVVEMNKTEST